MLIRQHDYCIGVPWAGYKTQEKDSVQFAVLSHSTMPQMSHVLREHALRILTAGVSTRVGRELNVQFSTKGGLQCFFTYLEQFRETN